MPIPSVQPVISIPAGKVIIPILPINGISTAKSIDCIGKLAAIEQITITGR